MIRILGIIPARYASSRHPATALADMGGKTMIQRVYDQARKSDRTARGVVATDRQETVQPLSGFGGEARMTQTHHPSGTDRCYEAYTLLAEQYDYIINIQGDEPFIQPAQIDLLASTLDGKTEIATLIKRIETGDELSNAGEVK